MKILVQNRYFPKPGKQKEVYELRKQASVVRTETGAPRGQVFKETSGAGKKCVVWECRYVSRDARKKDVQRMRSSAEFTQVRNKIRPLLERFQRTVRELE